MVFDIFIISFLVLLLWMQTCMIITEKQRQKIFTPEYYENVPYLFFKNKLFAKRSVTYSKHLWYLMTFRNPKKLYDTDAFEEFENNKNYTLFSNSKHEVMYGYFDNYHKFVLHREDGPAMFSCTNTGTMKDLWWFKGIEITDEVGKWLTDHNISDYTCMSDEDKFALSFYMRSLSNV